MKPTSKSRRSSRLARAVALGLIALPACLLLGATPTSMFQTDPDRLVFATVHWRDRAELQRIAAHFQHLMVDEKTRTARTEASYDDLRTLRRMGVRVEIDEAATDRMRRAEQAMAQRDTLVQQQRTPQGTLTDEGLNAVRLTAEQSIPGYACYRTVEETYQTMNQLASRRPTLASVVDIGPSWIWDDTNGTAGYRMRVLRLNSSASDAWLSNKPNVVVLSAIHAREYTTAELTTRFAEWLVNNYGTDAEATWLLESFRFHFILQGNPDGRKKAESGLSWRKNVDTDNGNCSANAYGVDLNRNFSWRFGTVSGGSSSNACDSTYRGPSAVSEAETQNLMDYIVGTRGSDGTYTGGVLPDRRTDTGAAPVDYRGLFLDIHSYSQMVLWPWAHTSATAPNMAGLRTLGRRMAWFNNYSPRQWIGLYAADGTNTDTIYGITGAPSYTVELGQSFFEDCNTFETSTYPKNLAMLKYAARSAAVPYIYPSGPETTTIAVSAGTVQQGNAIGVSGWVDDSRFNQSNGGEPVQRILVARAFVDALPWTPGAPSYVMRAWDGAYDYGRELVTAAIPTTNLKPGRHVVFVQGQDQSGARGTPKALYFNVAAKP